MSADTIQLPIVGGGPQSMTVYTEIEEMNEESLTCTGKEVIYTHAFSHSVPTCLMLGYIYTFIECVYSSNYGSST